ncbi:Tubulin gamma chain [Dictyocoela muelleri]|nr:Tubulin gamma chain [Dictyocoela muelleri]
MREIVTLQFGQCGNQVGKSFWNTITSEHGLTQSGEVINTASNDKKNIFFYQADNGSYVPRCILVDLEPRVIMDCGPIFNKENVYVHEGGGAGNNWAHGYFSGKEISNDVLEIIQREAEGCERLEGFSMIHSVAGGTGSGTGSYFIEQIKDIYHKKILTAFSIFPNNDEVSDVVVQPYNSVMTLQFLNKFCDMVVVMDNGALGRTALDALRIKTPTYQEINSLISTVMSASTSTLRFPTYLFSDLYSLIASLTNKYQKFVVPSYTPFKSPNSVLRKTSVSDIMRRLYLPKNRLASVGQGRFINTINVLNNATDFSELQRSILRIYDTQIVNSLSFHNVVTRHHNEMTGLSLANLSGFSHLLTKISNQYDKLKKRNAFIEMYKRYIDISEFDRAREDLESLIKSYENYFEFPKY